MARMSPGLPEGLWRDQFLEIVIEALTGALTPTAEKVLRFYARHTRPADWSERGEGPVCFVAQKSAAERMGMDRKSVYNAERALERLGLIRKDALENGHRRSPAGQGEAIGIRFAPAINRYQEFTEAARTAARLRDRLDAKRRIASGLRFRLRRELRHVEGSESDLIREEFAALPRQVMRMTDISRLDALATKLKALLARLQSIAERLETVEETVISSGDIPRNEGEISPHHIYSTINSSFVDCNEDISANAMAENSNPSCDKSAHGKENKGSGQNSGQSAVPVSWTMKQLYSAGSDEFRALMDEARDRDGELGMGSLVSAADTIRHLVGVTPNAWAEACSTLGRHEAALALLVLDRNRTHPQTPVRNPQGALRAMVRRAREGQLNLDASLFGIIRRAGQGGRPTGISASGRFG